LNRLISVVIASPLRGSAPWAAEAVTELRPPAPSNYVSLGEE
jgi:hypothetical protein